MILNKTKSVCPECLKRIDALIIEEDKSVLMQKTCKNHGRFNILLSKEVQGYKELSDFYFIINSDGKRNKQDYYNLVLTMKCNLNCPICFLNARKRVYKEPTLDFIKNSINGLKKSKIGLWGGEPTLRKDLPEIIKIIANSGNIPVLYTNGIKLSNLNYLKNLKESGLKGVHTHLDGFDNGAIKRIRGDKYVLRQKIKALINLKKLNIPTVLELIYIKRVNEREIKNVFEFALKNDFVKAVAFNTCSSLGKGKKFMTLSNTSEINHIIDIFRIALKGRLSKQDVIIFQKLFYIFSKIVNKQKCFYKLYFPIIRMNKGYKPFNELVNFQKLDKVLTKYKNLKLKNKWVANLYILTKLPFHLLNKKTLPLSYDFVNTFLRKKRFTATETSKRLLIISFGTICDQYNYDTESAKYCHGGEISTDNGVIEKLAEANLLREVQESKNG